MRILVVEDDREMAGFIARGLMQSGHVVDIHSDGREGTLAAIEQPYDVLILDRMLPGLDGLSILKTLRASNVLTPALFLTSMATISDRVEGLTHGADDYLVKPFALPELSARVEALARRARGNVAVETTLRAGDLELDLIKRSATRAGAPIELLNREFDLLEVLMRNMGRIVTRAMLLEQVWNLSFDPRTSVVETHMSRLRAKIDRPFAEPLIHTVRGIGYSLHPPGQHALG